MIYKFVQFVDLPDDVADDVVSCDVHTLSHAIMRDVFLCAYWQRVGSRERHFVDRR